MTIAVLALHLYDTAQLHSVVRSSIIWLRTTAVQPAAAAAGAAAKGIIQCSHLSQVPYSSAALVVSAYDMIRRYTYKYVAVVLAYHMI